MLFSFRNLMFVSAVLAAGLGIGLLLFPVALTTHYGLTLTPDGVLIARFLGSAALGYGALSWLVRDVFVIEFRRAILLTFLITDGGGFLVALAGQLSGHAAAFGWLLAGAFFLLSAGWAYLLYQEGRS